MYKEFREQMLRAQHRADKTNCGVPVEFCGGKTLVEPNLPKFTHEELSARLERIRNIPKQIEINLSDDESEIDELSQSILASGSSIKKEIFNKKEQVNITYSKIKMQYLYISINGSF